MAQRVALRVLALARGGRLVVRAGRPDHPARTVGLGAARERLAVLGKVREEDRGDHGAQDGGWRGREAVGVAAGATPGAGSAVNTRGTAARWRSGDPRVVLGVGPFASRAACRAAYLELARRYHPDKSGSAATGEAFAAINAAWTKIDGGGY